MRILFCNLDPHWEFSTLVHHHCLDVYTDPGIEFWQVGAADRENPDSWGDWPRRIAREHLRAELMEAGQLLEPQEPLLLLVSVATPDPALEQELALLAGEPWWPNSIWVWALAAKAQRPPALRAASPGPGRESTSTDSPPTREERADSMGESTASCYTFLLDHDPRKRLYSLRVLGEWLSQRHDRDPPLLSNNGVFQLTLENRPPTPLSDCVMQYWPEKASGLLQAADDAQRPDLDPWRQAVQETYRAAFTRLGANPDQLQSLERFLDERLDDQALPQSAAPWSSEPTEPAQQWLHWRTPWFHDPRLPQMLHQQLNDFTDSLDRTLTEHYASLHQTQQRERTRQLVTEHREQHGDLAGIHAWTLGISEATINQLQHDHAELGCYRAAVRRRVERLTTFLRHRIERGVRRRAPVFGDSDYRYRRQWLAEDAELNEARREAKTAARRLVGRAWFWGGLAAIAGLALLPVLILRGPMLLGVGGVRQYFNTPSWWGADSAWIALFAMLYLGFALYQLVQRRRRLRIAQDRLRLAARELWRQNLVILGNLFRYQDHSQAQRLLTALDEHCERLLGELAQTQASLHALRRDLQRQLQPYPPLPLSAPSPVAGSVLGALFDGRDPRAESPLQWLRRCLESEDWRRLPEQEIAVTVDGRPDHLKSRYLWGCAAIHIREAHFPAA